MFHRISFYLFIYIKRHMSQRKQLKSTISTIPSTATQNVRPLSCPTELKTPNSVHKRSPQVDQTMVIDEYLHNLVILRLFLHKCFLNVLAQLYSSHRSFHRKIRNDKVYKKSFHIVGMVNCNANIGNVFLDNIGCMGNLIVMLLLIKSYKKKNTQILQ